MDFSELARKHGFSVGAVEHLAAALKRGGGKLAQFNHPELGGMGQWMPGMIMISDPFNHALKARLECLVLELGQTSGAEEAADLAGESGPLRFAYYRRRRRLVVEQWGQTQAYDTSGVEITSASVQSVGDAAHLLLAGPQGVVDWSRLPSV